MKKPKPIPVAYSHYYRLNEGAVIGFDLRNGTCLFYKGSAVLASRLCSEPLRKFADGSPEVVLSNARAEAFRKRVEDELGKKFLLLTPVENQPVWRVVKFDELALNRFIEVHAIVYEEALSEVRNGLKEGCWMWYMFPQLRGLGRSEESEKYGIADLAEARSFLRHPFVGRNLVNLSKALLEHAGKKTAVEIFGDLDAMKLKSSMTLFSVARSSEGCVFNRVLESFFGGERDALTLRMLGMKKDGSDPSS